MLVLIENPARLASYVGEVPEIAWELIDASVCPLTIIYPKARNLAKNLVAEDGSIGIRITNDPFCSELLKRFGKPVVSSSANISGELTPAVFSDIMDEIIESADYVIKWRQDDPVKRPPSAIIKLGSGGLFKIIRA